MRYSGILLAGSLLLPACGGATAQAPAQVVEPVSDPARWEGDARLYRMLNTYPITQVQYDSLDAYAGQAGALMNNLLAQAAEDGNAPSAVRANALHVLARRQAGTHLSVFRSALDDDDVRVRAMAIASMRDFNARYPMETLQLARMALRDSSVQVQAQALPIIGERDVPLLRQYHASIRDEELRRITAELISVAEERGAPLAGDSLTGVLRRTTPTGITLTFTPRQHWPKWNASVGSVRVERPGAAPFTIDEVEAVAGVVPVFFSSDGTYAVYERARTIVVRNLATGAVDIVGPGIAPRIRPFADDFVYMKEVENGRTDQRDRTHIRYSVRRASFTGTPPESELGSTGAYSMYSINGNYPPVRWMRVEERSGSYYLVAEGMEAYLLPDPFAAAPAR